MQTEPVSSDPHYAAGYADPTPWPVFAAQGPNLRDAALLAEDYAGPGGELTASLQYIYHHTVIQKYPDVSAAMEKIAIVEMMHMEKLAGAILQLGGDPRFAAKAGNWSACEVQYGGSLAEALHLDLAGEYAAIRHYEAHMRAVQSPGLRELLGRIVRDEQVHVRCFQTLLAKYGM